MSDFTEFSSNQRQDIDFGKVLRLALDKWYLFVIFISISLSVAYAYNWYTHPVYEMRATVLVDDETSDISKSILEEVGVGGGKSRNIENEIAILQSRSLITKAIRSLNINISYQANLGLKTRELYGDSPILLEYIPSEVALESFDAVISAANESDFTIAITAFSSSLGALITVEEKLSFGEDLVNDWGHFRITKNGRFNDHVIGSNAVTRTFNISYRSDEKLVSHFKSLLKVDVARAKASILELKLQERVPEKGVDMLNALLNVYVRASIEKKNQLASNSLKFIDLQLEVITAELSEIESDIQSFKTESGITDIGAEANFFLGQVGGLDKTVSELDVKLSFINYLEGYIKSGKDLNNASPSSLGIDDPLLNRLIARLSELSTEKESLLKVTKADNPVVSLIDSKINDTKKALLENISSIKSGLQASRTEVNKQLGKVEGKVKSLPKAEYELLALQRNYSIKESLYLLLLEKKSENAILLASTVSNNVIVDAARSSDEPVAPKKSLVYLLGLLAGLGFPMLYIGYLITFNDKIRDKKDLIAATPIPLLGIIPHNPAQNMVVVGNNSNSPIAESFRAVRTNLTFLMRADNLGPKASAKVIQVTSSVGSEGKSFCSVNLAASMAIGGSRTVIIGLDLRKPKLAQYFDISNDVGMSLVLSGHMALNDAIIHSEIPGLDIIVGGPIPPNPSELLMSSKMADVIKELENSYDYIVLDTPPIALVTDSLILSEYAATTVYMVRQNISRSNSLAYMNDLYRSNKIQSASILFNDVKQSRFGYGYGYGYGDGYGYGYGYGYYSEPKGPLGILRRIQGLFRK